VNACFCCVGFIFFHTKPRDWLGKRLRNDPFCVEWDVKPQLNQSVNPWKGAGGVLGGNVRSPLRQQPLSCRRRGSGSRKEIALVRRALCIVVALADPADRAGGGRKGTGGCAPSGVQGQSHHPPLGVWGEAPQKLET